MILWRLTTVSSLILLLTACTATPDLSGWANSSTELAKAVSNENKELLIRTDQNINELQIGEKENWKLVWNEGKPNEVRFSSQDWKEKRDKLESYATGIDAIMQVMVVYANALSELSSAGETGGEAAKSIGSSLDSLVSDFGSSGLITRSVLAVLGEFSDAFTRVQAQRSLTNAMKEASDKVPKLAAKVAELSKEQVKLAGALYILERHLIRQAAGIERMKWYVRNNNYNNIEGHFSSGNISHPAELLLLQELEKRFQEREKRRSDANVWWKNRKAASNFIKKSAQEWNVAHGEALSILENCGGFLSLKTSCGNYSSANLQLLVNKISSVTSKPEDEETDSDSN